MKKGVAVLVSAICLLAVVFVTVFGTRPQGIVPVIYITNLTIKPSDNSRYWTTDSGVHQCVIEYDPNKEVTDGEDCYMPYIFVTDILPENATNRSFVYTLAKEYENYITFSSGDQAARQGAFLIKKITDRADPMVVSISVSPQDGGSGKGDTLKIVIVYDKVYGSSSTPSGD